MNINNIALIQEIASKSESLNVPSDRSESNNISVIGKQDKFISIADAANKQGPLEKNELKVVVAGNVGSGKSTSIKAIS